LPRLIADAEVASYYPYGFRLRWTTNETSYTPPTGVLNEDWQNSAEVIFVAFGTTVHTKVGSFAAPASSGTQVVGGIGFEPKAVIFFWTAQSVLNNFADNVSAGYGFATGAVDPDRRQRAVVYVSKHNQALAAHNPGAWQWRDRSVAVIADEDDAFPSPTRVSPG
jgi:hypothetical protein